MSQTSKKPDVGRLVIKHLSHPLKLRLALCAALIVPWQLLFVSLMCDDVAATTSRIGTERKRAATARDIEKIKTAFKPHRDLVGTGEDEQELMRHVIDRIRPSPLRLIDLKPDKPKDLGPYVAIGLQLSLEGKYLDLDQFLGWAEVGGRLLRVDAIRLTPDTRNPGLLHVNLTLVALVDKSAPAAKTKREQVKSK